MNGVPSISFVMSLTRYTNILSPLYDSKGESVTMKGHAGAVRSVDFSSDSKHLITASDDKTVKVHRPSRLSLLHSINAVTYFYTDLLALTLPFLLFHSLILSYLILSYLILSYPIFFILFSLLVGVVAAFEEVLRIFCGSQ